MNDTAIKNFCIWARRELIEQVTVQAQRYGIREDGYDPATADAIDGRLLSAVERRQRADLIRRLGSADGADYQEAYEKLIDQAAYTWFNRMVAIRFMELNDRLPSHVRMLSAEDGSFRPQVLREALDVRIEGLDATMVSALVSASDDEVLFRYLFLAQCRELATCLPDVFEPVGSAMELLLPEGLLRNGSVLDRLVTDIPEDDWRNGVEVVGWMYQYYVAERKDEVFASFKKGKKADVTAIAPATQLFTPNWIVQYLTQNSLGRLWLKSHPESPLAAQMPYYIPDDLGVKEGDNDAIPNGDVVPDVILSELGENICHPERSAEGAKPKDLSAASITPESIKVIDPACGSGHILVYAFRLLAAMYEEAGHARRDIPRLILENNLTGCEIDPRAAQIASFALAMEACELDRRYLTRDTRVSPRIVCLLPAEIDSEELELMPYLAERTQLLDAMAHMGECGSLFVPELEDLDALLQADDELDAREGGGDLLAYAPHAAVRQMMANCAPLAETYDVVIANPPYMGSSNMDKWLANWTKKHYPDTKRDLCTCFIDRGFTLAKPDGYIGMITASSWMFISSFEKFREDLLGRGSILAMVQQSTHGYAGVTVPTCIFAFQLGDTMRVGAYIRLEDFDRPQLQKPKTEEAIANPTCGWFYRRSSGTFKSIPGTPIAYWASNAAIRLFRDYEPIKSFGRTSKGLITGDNDSFFRLWWEIPYGKVFFSAGSVQEADESGLEWFPLHKGGIFRKWYGNHDYVIHWADSGKKISEHAKKLGRHFQDYSDEMKFKPSISWSMVSSGAPGYRIRANELSDHVGTPLFMENLSIAYTIGYLNTSIVSSLLRFLSPTMVFNIGELERVPIPTMNETNQKRVESIANECIDIAKRDWDSMETSWNFRKSPLM